MTDTETISAAYANVGVPLDRLPYSTDFDRVRDESRRLGLSDISRERIWVTLVDLRKRGGLPRVGRSKKARPTH